MALLTHPSQPPATSTPNSPNTYYLNGSTSHITLCYRVHMLDIETTHKLASFLEAKFSLKNTTEIPRPVHGPLQFQQGASARHPTKANTAKALVEPDDFPALWLDGLSLKPANHHSTPNLGHRALLISCGLHGHRHKKSPRARLKTVETDPIFEAKNGLNGRIQVQHRTPNGKACSCQAWNVAA